MGNIKYSICNDLFKFKTHTAYGHNGPYSSYKAIIIYANAKWRKQTSHAEQIIKVM